MKLIHGEALAALRDLPDGSVDALITDPPYSSGGMMRGDRAQDTRTKYVQSDSRNQQLADFGGDSRDQRAYAYWCRDFIGVEMTGHYHEVAERRIGDAVRGYHDDGAQMVLGVDGDAA